jgi:hypothetical protein
MTELSDLPQLALEQTGDDDASGALVVEEGKGGETQVQRLAQLASEQELSADETAGDDVVLEERARWQVVAIKPASEGTRLWSLLYHPNLPVLYRYRATGV